MTIYRAMFKQSNVMVFYIFSSTGSIDVNIDEQFCIAAWVRNNNRATYSNTTLKVRRDWANSGERNKTQKTTGGKAAKEEPHNKHTSMPTPDGTGPIWRWWRVLCSFARFVGFVEANQSGWHDGGFGMALVESADTENYVQKLSAGFMCQRIYVFV